jgi:putative transposase
MELLSWRLQILQFGSAKRLCRADVFDHIKVFYNRTRRHTHPGGISSDAFERASA